MKNKSKCVEINIVDNIHSQLSENIIINFYENRNFKINIGRNISLALMGILKFEISAPIHLCLKKYFKKKKKLFLINDNLKENVLKNIKNVG